MPKLDKLQEQKRSFLTFQKTTSELEHLARAYDWVKANSRVSRKDTDIQEKKGLIQKARREILVAKPSLHLYNCNIHGRIRDKIKEPWCSEATCWGLFQIPQLAKFRSGRVLGMNLFIYVHATEINVPSFPPNLDSLSSS